MFFLYSCAAVCQECSSLFRMWGSLCHLIRVGDPLWYEQQMSPVSDRFKRSATFHLRDTWRWEMWEFMHTFSISFPLFHESPWDGERNIKAHKGAELCCHFLAISRMPKLQEHGKVPWRRGNAAGGRGCRGLQTCSQFFCLNFEVNTDQPVSVYRLGRRYHT